MKDELNVGALKEGQNTTLNAAPATAPTVASKKHLIDLTKYRRPTSAPAYPDTMTGTQTNIPVRKPGKKNFFRVHPDPAYHLYGVGVIQGENNEVYLLGPDLELPEDVKPLITCVNLLFSITHTGKAFVWFFSDAETSWKASALRVAKRAQSEWVRIQADFETGGYIIFPPPEALRSKEPGFPKLSAEEVFTLAFEKQLIVSVDDPIIRRFRGLE